MFYVDNLNNIQIDNKGLLYLFIQIKRKNKITFITNVVNEQHIKHHCKLHSRPFQQVQQKF